MVKNNETISEDEETEEKIKVYTLRWWILFFLALLTISSRIRMNAFGIINNVYKVYFNTYYSVVDWLTLIQILGNISANIIFAKLTFSGIINHRKLCLMMIGCVLFNFLFDDIFCLSSAFYFDFHRSILERVWTKSIHGSDSISCSKLVSTKPSRFGNKFKSSEFCHWKLVGIFCIDTNSGTTPISSHNQ